MSAERKVCNDYLEDHHKGDKWHCREFRLPENAKVDDIKASMHDGVLVIKVPKDDTFIKNSKSSKRKAVYISGSDEAPVSKGLSRFVCRKA